MSHSSPVSPSNLLSFFNNNDDDPSCESNLEDETKKVQENMEKPSKDVSIKPSRTLASTPTVILYPEPDSCAQKHKHVNKDLMISILKHRCPIGIFKCLLVSKDWSQIISDDNFKQLQYNYSCEDVYKNMKLLWSLPRQSCLVETNLFLDQPPNILDFNIQEGYVTDFVGSVNGLVCVLLHQRFTAEPTDLEFVILNPALKNGPRRKIKGPPTKGSVKAFGFLFNDTSKDYHMVYLEHDLEGKGCYTFTFECTKSRWISARPVPYTIYPLSTSATVLHSRLYWLMIKTDESAIQNLVVVGLDPNLKRKEEIQCPDFENPDIFCVRAHLFNLNNHLNIAHIIPNQDLIWYTYEDSTWKIAMKMSLPLCISQPLSLNEILTDL